MKTKLIILCSLILTGCGQRGMVRGDSEDSQILEDVSSIQIYEDRLSKLEALLPQAPDDLKPDIEREMAAIKDEIDWLKSFKTIHLSS